MMFDAYTHLDMSAPDPLEDLYARMRSANIDRALVVETWSGDNYACLQKLVVEPDLRVSVALCKRPEAEVGDVIGSSVITAIRFKTGDLRKSSRDLRVLESTGKWLVAHGEDGIALLTRELLIVADQFPKLHIYVPHLAWPRRDRCEDCGWHASLQTLSRIPNVVVGVSALAHYSNEPFPHLDVRPYVLQILEQFKEEAIVIGSDYPLFEKDRYPDYMRLAAEWVQGRTPEKLQARGVRLMGIYH